MNPLAKLLLAVKVVGLQDSVFEQARAGDWKAAQSNLRALYAAMGADMPSMKVPNEINLLCAMVASNLGDAELALEASRLAIRDLGRPELLQGTHSRKYLIAYAREILEFCDYYLDEDLTQDLAEAERLSAGMELGRVYKVFLNRFPLNAITYPQPI